MQLPRWRLFPLPRSRNHAALKHLGRNWSGDFVDGCSEHLRIATKNPNRLLLRR
jgi:hypothetical protein